MLSSFVCACMFVLGVIVYAFAVVCCKLAFHAKCVYVACVFCVRVCLFVARLRSIFDVCVDCMCVFVFVIVFVCLCLFA